MDDTVYLIDFDGTIVDVWVRYHKVYTEAAKVDISFRDYVVVKRELEQDALVAKFFGFDLTTEYYERKKNLLENADILKTDTLLLEETEVDKLLKRSDVCVFTKRRNKETFFQQMKNLGLGGLSNKVIVVDGVNYATKVDYIKSNLSDKKVVVVGDSEEDAQCSLLSNVKVYLVSTGLRDPQKVKNHEKCRIVNSLSDVDILFK